MIKNLLKEEIAGFVKETLRSPENVIKMLQKYGETALYRIDHCQLHLDFDNRDNSSWNHDMINLFPTDHPVEMTSWKGIVYVHYLNEEPVDCNCKGTREIMEMIVTKCGDEAKIREIIKSKKVKNEY